LSGTYVLKLDVITTNILSVFSAFLLSLFMLHTRWTRTTYPGFNYWLAGVFSWLVGLILTFLLRGTIPPLFSIVAGNLLILLYPILLFEGTNRFYGIPARWWRTPLNLVLFLIAAIVFYQNAIVTDNLPNRVITASVMSVILCLRVAVEPLFSSLARQYTMQWFLSVSLLPVIASHLIRIISYSEAPPFTGYQQMLSNDLLLWLVMMNSLFISNVMAYYCISLTSDRTEQELRASRKRQQALSDAQRQFFRMVSHEFRTPLAVIDRSAQMIAFRDEEHDPALAKRVATIREQTNSLLNLLEACLNESVLARGALTLSLELLDSDRLLQLVVSHHQELVPEREIRLEQQSDTCSIIQGDERLLYHLFSIVLDNALKFSGQATPIIISTAKAADSCCITIADTGVGIPSDQLGQIGTHSFRADTAKGISGTGIGLHTAHLITSLHHGTLQINSSTDSGTTVTITLPC